MLSEVVKWKGETCNKEKSKSVNANNERRKKMAELIDWLHHESVTRAANNTASSYVRQDHHLQHGSLEPHITNADRIRAMTDEELAEWVVAVQQDVADYYCNDCSLREIFPTEKDSWIEWLRKECDDR